MELLNKQELLNTIFKMELTEGTNRILEFPFKVKIDGIVNNVFTDVMIVLTDGKLSSIECDVVEDFYTDEQKELIKIFLDNKYKMI